MNKTEAENAVFLTPEMSHLEIARACVAAYFHFRPVIDLRNADLEPTPEEVEAAQEVLAKLKDEGDVLFYENGEPVT